MKVTLLSYTPDALELLLFTKETRLSQDPGRFDEIKSWPQEQKLRELGYMLDTIQSSWEFVNYCFLVSDVTRALTHQMVRTRQGSYAQQSQRTVDMSGFSYETTGDLLREDFVEARRVYNNAMSGINTAYHDLLKLGIAPQDARGILPTNIHTSIVAQFNLRTLSDMARVRLCTRTQGEYQTVFRAMRDAVLRVHTWADPFLRVHCAATGVCCFPRYTECPIKGPVLNPKTKKRYDGLDLPPASNEEIQQSWESVRFEAKPKMRVSSPTTQEK